MRAGGGLLALMCVLQWTASAADTTGEAFVAKCRAQCSRKLTSDGSKGSCLKEEECLRCWASCQAFQRDHYIREYCKLNKACSAGCRQACDFYLTSTGSASQPVQLSSPAAQTAAQTAPEVMSDMSAQSAEPAVSADSAQDSILRSPSPALPSKPTGKTSSSGLQDQKARWRPHLSSLLAGSPLVSATVTWRSRGRDASYLVTWELRSGGLRGHLVSEEPRVSLSLWPDEDYVVQVFSGEDSSEPLFVSTKTSPAAEKRVGLSMTTLLVVVVGVIGFTCLLVAAVGCCVQTCQERWRRDEEALLSAEDGISERRSRNRTVGTVLRPPGKAVEVARLAPLFVISHSHR